jgi:hypothetical protein
MNSTLKENIFAENKLVKPNDPQSWDWEMTRTIAALYNSGGGILRTGVDDSGNAVGFNNLSDYEPDKSPLAATLAKYLTPVPPFKPTLKNDSGKDYVEVRVSKGVTFPVVVKERLVEPPDLRNPKHRSQEYGEGTVFARVMNHKQVSSQPPQNPSDWQTVLQLWETNRGATVQGPLVAQFCLVINKWNPFDPGDTGVKRWEAKCVADTAKTLGREKLWTGLISIWKQMQLSTKPPSLDQAIKDQEGSDYKQPLLREVEQLCQELGLTLG